MGVVAEVAQVPVLVPPPWAQYWEQLEQTWQVNSVNPDSVYVNRES